MPLVQQPPGPPASPQRQSSRIPRDFIDSLLSKLDIVSVVGSVVSLKKSGANHLGLCPFHGEKSPSFTVSQDKQFFHCFGCGAHGSAITFVMDHYGMPFRDAVKSLAGECGLSLPESSVGFGMAAEVISNDKRSAAFSMMEAARKFYCQELKKSVPAREYLRKTRELDPTIASRFIIGYAPADWKPLKSIVSNYASDEILSICGLVRDKQKEDGSITRYDWFRDRIMFGVRDRRGRLIAWGGRTISGEDPKYLNSPDSPIFDKSETLFGAYEAKDDIRRMKEILIVEGYMGVIMLAQHGITNAVASMGTSFTASHLETALSMANRLVFCFDGDEAGKKAARRALSMVSSMIQDTNDIRFMMLPSGMDPDDFVRAYGAQAFNRIKDGASGFSDFLIQCCKEDAGIDAARPQEASADMRARFAALANEIVQRISRSARLRTLVERQVRAETSRSGGSDRSRALMRATRLQDTGLWSRLQRAVTVAPQAALHVREDLIMLLDEHQPQELALKKALHVLGDQPNDLIDRVDNPEYHPMKDLLDRSIEMIIKERTRELKEELRRMFEVGDIDESTYLAEIAKSNLSSTGSIHISVQA